MGMEKGIQPGLSGWMPFLLEPGSGDFRVLNKTGPSRVR